MFNVFFRPEKEIVVIKNALVDYRHGIILDDNDVPLFDLLDEVLFWTPETYSRCIRSGSTHDFEKHRRVRHVQKLSEELASTRPNAKRLREDVNYIYMLHPFGFHAFGHLFDSLQRLIPARSIISEQMAVIHARSDRIIDFDKHLEILGFRSSRCIEARENLIVPSLVVSPWAAPPAQITPANYQLIFDLYTAQIDKSQRRRLYLSRNHVRPGNRSVVNEDQVLDQLIPLGFEVLYGDEPIDQIVMKFFQAEFVTGAHGSLFANTMFCQNDARIFEFCPDNRPDFSFKRKIKKAEYYVHHLVEADEEFNIKIDVDEILRHLDGK